MIASRPVSAGAQAALAALLSALLAAPESCAWEPTPAQRQRLLAREIVVEAVVDPSGASGRAQAAVWITAPPSIVYDWMTDCDRAMQFVPNMKKCQVVARGDADMEIVAHEIDYSWYLPRTRYTFRATYQRPTRVDFKEVSGDLAINQGSWQLIATPDAAHTLVLYEVRIKPRMYVPQWLIRRSLRRDLPELLGALRRVSEIAANKP